MAYPIVNSSMPGDMVLDPFGGSGSTLLACEQTGRSCFMIEIEERFADVIVSLYVAMCSGEDAVLMRGGSGYRGTVLRLERRDGKWIGIAIWKKKRFTRLGDRFLYREKMLIIDAICVMC